MIVFSEYSTQGLNTSKWLTDEFLCDIPGKKLNRLEKPVKKPVFTVYSPSWREIRIKTRILTIQQLLSIRTARSVCICHNGVFYYFGEGQITNYDGTVLVQGQRNLYEIVTAEIFPEIVDAARKEWGLENNIYNLGHRGYVAYPGGEPDASLTYIKDLEQNQEKTHTVYINTLGNKR